MTVGRISRPPVLVVDDDVVVRRVLRAVLETDGHDVVEAAGALAALDMVAARRPGLVVLDLLLPDLDGLEVCRRIGGAAKVVVLTARDDPALAQRCADAGADAYVVKPFGSAELLGLVGRLLALD